MATSERKTPAPDKNLLWSAARGMCEFPDCRQVLVANGGTKLVTVGEIAHIFAHSGGGPRFDASLGEAFIDSYDNWLLMCRRHHRIVDGDEEAFPSSLLITWKTDRDKKFLRTSKRADYAHLASPPPLAQHFEARPTLQAKLEKAMPSGRAAITGLSGSGKTQLAAHYFNTKEDQYAFRWWIRGQSIETIMSGLASLAPLLEIDTRKEADIRETANLIVAELGRKSGWLIVFDSVARMESLEAFLPASGDVIVTSQATGWPGFTRIVCGQLSPNESLNLLKVRLGPIDTTDLSEVAHFCGHHPLTLAHVSGYMASRNLSGSRAVELLSKKRVEVLSRGEGAASQTLVNTVNLSLTEMTPDAQVMVHTLAALAATPFPILNQIEVPEKIHPLWSNEIRQEDAVAELLRYSLVERNDDELLLHELVQHIIWESMTGDEQYDAVSNASYLMLEKLPVEAITTVDRPQFERILPHAHRLLFLMGSLPGYSFLAAFLLNRLGSYYSDRHELEYGRSLLGQGLEALDAAASDVGYTHELLSTRGSLIHNLAHIEYSCENLIEAEALAREALSLKLQHAPDDDRLIAYSENFLATICHHKGALTEARQLLISALRRFRGANVTLSTAGCLVDLAQLELEEGRGGSARAALDEARVLAEEHPKGADQLVRTYVMLASVHHYDGKPVEGLKLAFKAVEIVRRFHHEDVDLVRALTTQGVLLMEVGNRMRGIAVLEEALEILHGSTETPSTEEARARGNLGSALFQAGRVESGIEELERSHDDLADLLPNDHPTLHTAEQMLSNARTLMEESNSFLSMLRSSLKGMSRDEGVGRMT